MKIKQWIIGLLSVVSLMGCSAESKMEEPSNGSPETAQIEKERSISWKHTLDEGQITAFDRQMFLSECIQKELELTQQLKQSEEKRMAEIEAESEEMDQTLETVESNGSTQMVETNTHVQQTVANQPKAPSQNVAQTKSSPPKQEPTQSVSTKPKENVEAPKPEPKPVEKPKERQLMSGWVGNTGRIWKNGQEANEWASEEIGRVLKEKDEYYTGRWVLVTLFYTDGSEEFSVDLYFE